MIIIEGCDIRGKRFVMDYLCKNINNLELLRPKVKAHDDKERYFNFLMKIFNIGDYSKVKIMFDGFIFNELVYGEVLRGESIFTEEQAKIIKDNLLLTSPLVIFCKRDTDALFNELDETAKLDVVRERIELVQNKYTELFDNRKCPYKSIRIEVFDFQNDNIADLESVVKRYISIRTIFTSEK